jgi:hypothetical protein
MYRKAQTLPPIIHAAFAFIERLTMYTTKKQIRAAFYADHPTIKRRPQNEHNATIRTAFCEFIDSLHRAGLISDALVRRVTL